MAVDLPEVHASALEHTRGLVGGVGPAHWDLESNCAQWSVRELLNHLVSGNLWVPELVAGRTIAEVGDRLDGDVLGHDPLASYDASARGADAAFRAAGAMERPVAVSYGPVPGSVYCGHRFVDVLVHGWDVARSTGQDEVLPEGLVAACWEVIEPQLDGLVATGVFGTRIEAPVGGDPQAKLLAALGRWA